MLALHIAGGTIALLLGLFIIIARKGTNLHRLTGRIYFWGITAVCITALYMAFYKNIPFLLMIAVFSYYPVYNGFRRIREKNRFQSRFADKIIYSLSLLFCAGMAVYSVLERELILGVFTVLFFVALRTDFALYLRNATPPRGTYLLSHVGSMLGSYIAAVTAFFVVNFSEQVPGLLLWLGPTIVGTPLISFYIYRYSKRMKMMRKKEVMQTV